MNVATEFDVGPLTWVKSEIDLALERAVSALDQFSASVASGTCRAADPTQIRFCRTHLHQVLGALTIVGLDGVTQFAEALEGLLEAIETEDHPVGESSIALARESLEAIDLYLGSLVSGQAHQPLRLLPLYRKIQSARGVQRYSAVDLFFPDLSVRPPRKGMRVKKLDRAELSRLLNQERGRFQRGLLTWLRAPRNKSGVNEMREAVRHIEETQEPGAARAFWWVAGGFLNALAEGGLKDDANIKPLCARIDLQIRRLIDGSRNVAERLMRDTLYFVAGATNDAAEVLQIKQAYRLDALLPVAIDSVIPDVAQAAVDRLRDVISALEEAWNKFCAGSASSLSVFRENTGILSGLVERTGHTDFRRLAQAIAAAANWLAEKPARHSEALAMELATAILLARNARENYTRLGGDFAHQVDVTVERIHACIAGHPSQPGSEIPLLDEMSRRAQEKLLLGQVAKEIRSNLGQIEQTLDIFFRDVEKRSELASLETSFRQIIGALEMLRQDGAKAALQDCLETIRRFAAPDYIPEEGEFEQLASQLSIVGFFVEAIPRGVTDFESFVRKIQTPSRGEARGDEDAVEDDDSIVSIEQEVVQSRRETHELLGALKEQPEDTSLREEIRQNLETLKRDADLVADAKLGEQAKTMLSALASGSDVAPQIDQAMAVLKPEIPETSPSSQETLRLSQASNEEIDAELLGIFLEEANEVLAEVDANLRRLKGDIHDSNSLTNIRRSFHTLKGSGRMVGLKDLGETAWAIEQTLNLWLRLELVSDPDLLGLLDEAYDVFSQWVRYLETQSGDAIDPQALVARADALRAGIETGSAAVVTPQAQETPIEIAKELAEVVMESAETVPLPENRAEQDAEESIQIDLEPVSPEETSDVLAMSMETPAATDEALAESPETGLPSENKADQDVEFIQFDLEPVSPEETSNVLAMSVETPVATDEALAESAETGSLPENKAEQDTEESIQIDLEPVSPEETSDVLAMSMEGEESPAILDEPPVVEASAAESVAPVTPVAPPAQSDSGGKPGTSQQRIGISPALFEIFSEEARMYLRILHRELPVLESEEARPTPEEMCRAAHTLAGISATVGLLPINQLGHALEGALQRRDASGNPGSAQALGTVRLAIGELDSMFSALTEQRSVDVPSGLIEDLDSLYPASANLAAMPYGDDKPADAVVSSFSVEEPAKSAADGAPESAPEEIQDVSSEQKTSETPETSPAPLLPTIAPVRDEIDAQLLPIFLDEAVELIQGIATQLRVWRAAPESAEPVRVLARQLHTLKGSARMAGAMTLGEIAHALEDRVDQTSRADAVSMDAVDGIESAFESIRQIIERLQRGETLEPISTAPDTSIVASATPESDNASAPDDASATPKSDDVSGQTEPPVAQKRVVDARRSERWSPPPETESEAIQSQATLRVRASVVDRLVNEAGELSIARSRIEGEMRHLKGSLLDLTENIIRLRRQLRDIEMQAELQMQSHTAAIADEQHPGFDPLEFDRFTHFQELTRMMAESVNDVATVQQHLLKNLDDANAAILAQARQNREVQQELLSMRMIPFNSLADRLYRVVRQASKDLDKRVNMEIKGGQVELDRGVLDKIVAPLEHILRNAVAHGIEKRELRIVRGKPEIGEILLSLRQEGNEIVLILSDDGVGLNYGRIRERAVAAGLLGVDETADEARLAGFIFAAGFSTAEKLSQIAGRGVGMDVVRSEISSLGGRVEVESTPGRGTEFRLILPLTLVVTKALLIRAGSRTFAIPSPMIEQVLDLKEEDVNRVREAGQAEWQSNRYPFSYLPHLLGERSALPEQHRQYWVLLLRSGTRRIAVQVDELLGNQEIVVKNIGPQLVRVIGVDGATVLGNGQVVLILNPVALSTRALTETPARAAAQEDVQEAAKAPPALLPTVMVVDDSLTVRKVTGRLMDREGYRVVLAKDGVDALEKLLDVVPDVMLVDIEMPRMDGFDLTRNIRADERLRHVPIIMITSRTAEKHRAYASEIGVNHYLGKPYQEEELLGLVRGYMDRRQLTSDLIAE
jgi:chemosensory pili system protein ChpA (sensor histidine kinase/response regulator)